MTVIVDDDDDGDDDGEGDGDDDDDDDNDDNYDNDNYHNYNFNYKSNHKLLTACILFCKAISNFWTDTGQSFHLMHIGNETCQVIVFLGHLNIKYLLNLKFLPTQQPLNHLMVDPILYIMTLF